MITTQDIHIDTSIQLRDHAVDPKRVADMIDFVNNGGVLPPVTVVGADNLLADGHHRLEVALRLHQPTISANREEGGRGEALAISISHNDTAASKPLSPQERNRGIELLLKERWTQQKIAEATGLSHQVIANIGYNLRAALKFPAVKPSVAAEVIRIGSVSAKRAGGSPTILPEAEPVQKAVYDSIVAVEADTKKPYGQKAARDVVREIAAEMKAGTEPDVARIVASHVPPVKTTTPYDVTSELMRRVAAFRAVVPDSNGQSYPLEDVVKVVGGYRDNPAFASDVGLAPRAQQIARAFRDLAEELQRYAAVLDSDLLLGAGRKS